MAPPAGRRAQAGSRIAVMPALSLLRSVLTALLADRQRLALENLALRQQVAVLRRGV